MKGVAPFALLAYGAPALAVDAAAPEVASGLGQAVLGLAVVLALIWGAAWLMRRVQPRLGSDASVVRLVGSQAVGQRERVVVVEVAEQWLVVGVAPGHVTSLATLPKGVIPTVPTVPVTFGTLLARARGQRS